MARTEKVVFQDRVNYIGQLFLQKEINDTSKGIWGSMPQACIVLGLRLDHRDQFPVVEEEVDEIAHYREGNFDYATSPRLESEVSEYELKLPASIRHAIAMISRNFHCQSVSYTWKGEKLVEIYIQKPARVVNRKRLIGRIAAKMSEWVIEQIPKPTPYGLIEVGEEVIFFAHNPTSIGSDLLLYYVGQGMFLGMKDYFGKPMTHLRIDSIYGQPVCWVPAKFLSSNLLLQFDLIDNYAQN